MHMGHIAVLRLFEVVARVHVAPHGYVDVRIELYVTYLSTCRCGHAVHDIGSLGDVQV